MRPPPPGRRAPEVDALPAAALGLCLSTRTSLCTALVLLWRPPRGKFAAAELSPANIAEDGGSEIASGSQRAAVRPERADGAHRGSGAHCHRRVVWPARAAMRAASARRPFGTRGGADGGGRDGAVA